MSARLLWVLCHKWSERESRIWVKVRVQQKTEPRATVGGGLEKDIHTKYVPMKIRKPCRTLVAISHQASPKQSEI